MLKVWGRRNSSNVQKVLWLAGELGLEYEHIPAGGPDGRLDEPEFRKLNPFGLVPAIDDDGVAVWESHAIVRYLAERYGGEGFWPDVTARARIEPWMDWHQTAFQPAFMGGLFWGYFRTPEPQRNWPAIRQAQANCARLLQFVDGELAERPWLGGDEFSIADIPLGSAMYRYFALDLPKPDLPNVSRWYERLCARDPYREHIMLPYDELRGRLAF
jgi:glutathione S-transferase